MTITFFGVLWFLLLSFLLLYNDIEAAIVVLLFSMVLQCDNVIVLGEKGIGPQIITSAFFVLYYFISSYKPVVKKDFKSKRFVISLFLLCLYILVNSILCKKVTENYRDVVLLYVYLCASICLYNVRNSLPEKNIWNIVVKLYVFLLVVGMFQILATMYVIPKWLFTELLYNDTSESVYFHWQEPYFRMMSTFMEPSYYSGLLCGLIGVIIYNKKRLDNANIYIVCGLLELALTFSTTGYLTFICILIVLLLLDGSHNNIMKYLPIFIAIFLFVVLSWDTIISNIILNKLETGSGETRQLWNLKALDEFLSHTIIGGGYMTVRASSLILTIMANLGIMGLLFYLFVIFSCIYPLFKGNQESKGLSISVRLVFISVVISQMIACPDLSLCTFWLSIYLVVLTDSKVPTMTEYVNKILILLNLRRIKQLYYR